MLNKIEQCCLMLLLVLLFYLIWVVVLGFGQIANLPPYKVLSENLVENATS